jgi:hypothetical protein
MTQLTFTVVPSDGSPDSLIALEEWLRGDGLGSRIKRAATSPAEAGVGHQGSAIDAVVAVLDTSGIGILIRSVASLAKLLLHRERHAPLGYSLVCGDIKLQIKGDLNDAEIDEIIRMASRLFDEHPRGKA